MVGAVAPSSRFLARKMLAPIDFTSVSLIVEYGPGTGVFTREIVARLPASARLLVIETHPVFYEMLRTAYDDDPRVIVVNDSAENIRDILLEYNLGTPDFIVSGLPFAALPSSVSHAILQRTAELLDGNGAFITFQYTLLKQSLLRKYFNDIRVTRELRNLPPAYVLICHIV